jgi:RNA polymerase sigma factor (sigma-70 family)
VRSHDRIRQTVKAFRVPEHPGVRIPRHEVEDVTQDAFLRVLRKLTLQGSSIGELRAAVHTTTRRQCQDHCRAAMSRDKHLAGSLQDTYEGDEGPVSRFDAALGRLAGTHHDREEAARDELGLLRDLLPKLSNENQRAVLRLTMTGFDSRETAEKLGLTRDNVDQLRKRGIDNLRRMLGDDAP